MTTKKFQKELSKIEEKYFEKEIMSLENDGMIDSMSYDFYLFKKTTHFTLVLAKWQRWIRI